MGASGWDYIVPFTGNVEDSFRAARQHVLDSGQFIWNYGPDGFVDDESEAVRPATLQSLDEFKENEDFWDEGSHSILDTDRVVAADDTDQPGAIRPLSDDELRRYFGTTTPSRNDFDRAYQRGVGPLSESNQLRWSGRCAVLYDGGTPTQIAFWGFSGD